MIEKYKQIVLDNKFNTYFLCLADKDYNINKIEIVPSNPNCNCYSVAKAFTVFAIGLLYDKGLVKPSDLVVDILKKHLPSDMDEKWNRVSVHDCLLHRIGIEHGFLDIDCEDASLYETSNYLDIVFKTKLKYEAGEFYRYSDAAYYLLSRIVSELSGIDLADFLRPILMEKMRFKEFAWSKCPYGFSIGATGLYIRTEDMVKLGILFLNKGMWKDERIISDEWINLVLNNGYEFRKLKDNWYAKGGMRGQFLMFNCEKGISLACHSYDDDVSASKFV